MQLIRGLENLKPFLSGTLVTLGNFDGVHLGHQKLIKSLKELKKQHQLPIVVITFIPQPKEFFSKKAMPKAMRLREKYEALKALGVDYLCCLRFDRALADLSAPAFVQSVLLEKFSMRAIVVGYDFHFGAKRGGDFALLQKIGAENDFSVQQISPILINNEIVSSTRLREALQSCDFVLAKQLLGHHYRLCGRVIRGDQRGRELGFPTANIYLQTDSILFSGIFVVRVKLGAETIKGVASLGVRPTFGGKQLLLETYLFDFNRDIYGQYIEVVFLHKLRDEEWFTDVNALLAQMKIDAEQAKAYTHDE